MPLAKSAATSSFPSPFPKASAAEKPSNPASTKPFGKSSTPSKPTNDRFASKINQPALAQKDIGQESQQSPANEIDDALNDQLEFSSLNPALKNFVLAKIVHDISEPDYWTKWIDTTQSVVQRTQARLQDLREKGESVPVLASFLAVREHVRLEGSSSCALWRCLQPL